MIRYQPKERYPPHLSSQKKTLHADKIQGRIKQKPFVGFSFIF
jgi:hypothetical protein